MRFHAPWACVTSLLVFLLAVSSAPAATPAPCELITAQAAALLAGEPVGPPKDVKGQGCAYTTKSGALFGLAVTDVAPDDAKGYMAAMRSAIKAPGTTEEIPGLAEQNFLIVRPESEKNKNALVVIYHQKSLALGVQRKMTPELKSAMIQVMRQILSKL